MASLRLAGAMALLVALVPHAQAEIYKYIDKNGNLVLTDEPVPGAKKVETGPVMTIPAIDKNKLPPLPANKPATSGDYAITISSPVADSTFQRNSAEPVPVAVSVSPNLKAGHQLKILLDGKAFSDGAIAVSALERGSHTLSTQIVDTQGQTVKQGPSTTFHIQQIGVQSPARR